MPANWWVHRFPVTGTPATATYRINHINDMTSSGATMRSPDNDDGYSSIPIAEAALRNMGIEDPAQAWFLHRKGSYSSFQKTYVIDHSSSNGTYSKTCPGGPANAPFKTIAQLADEEWLNTLHTTNTCS